MMEEQLLIAYGQGFELTAIALMELLEMDGIQSKLVDVDNIGTRQLSKGILSKSQALLSICLAVEARLAGLLSNPLIQYLQSRNIIEIQTHHFFVVFDRMDAQKALEGVFELSWNGSFVELKAQIRAQLVARGWKPSTNPDGQQQMGGLPSQTIKGTRNIQVGGNIGAGGNIDIKI